MAHVLVLTAAFSLDDQASISEACEEHLRSHTLSYNSPHDTLPTPTCSPPKCSMFVDDEASASDSEGGEDEEEELASLAAGFIVGESQEETRCPGTHGTDGCAAALWLLVALGAL